MRTRRLCETRTLRWRKAWPEPLDERIQAEVDSSHRAIEADAPDLDTSLTEAETLSCNRCELLLSVFSDDLRSPYRFVPT